MPGSTPATSQLDWLISTTAMIVLSWSKATSDLLKSFGWDIRALRQLVAATKLPFPRRPPHSFSRSPGRERAGPFGGTADKRQSQTVAHLTGDRGFESLPLHQNPLPS